MHTKCLAWWLTHYNYLFIVCSYFCDYRQFQNDFLFVSTTLWIILCLVGFFQLLSPDYFLCLLRWNHHTLFSAFMLELSSYLVGILIVCGILEDKVSPLVPLPQVVISRNLLNYLSVTETLFTKVWSILFLIAGLYYFNSGNRAVSLSS